MSSDEDYEEDSITVDDSDDFIVEDSDEEQKPKKKNNKRTFTTATSSSSTASRKKQKVTKQKQDIDPSESPQWISKSKPIEPSLSFQRSLDQFAYKNRSTNGSIHKQTLFRALGTTERKQLPKSKPWYKNSTVNTDIVIPDTPPKKTDYDVSNDSDPDEFQIESFNKEKTLSPSGIFTPSPTEKKKYSRLKRGHQPNDNLRKQTIFDFVAEDEDSEKENERKKETNRITIKATTVSQSKRKIQECLQNFGKKKVQSIEDFISRCELFASLYKAIVPKFDSMKKNPKEVIQPPDTLQKELKKYQIIGLNWLYFINQEGLNGILADEMGLGKTIQTIALISLLMQKDEVGPHLIVVAASTLANWRNELEAWCPSLRVIEYYGSQKERDELQEEIRYAEDPYNVVMTTYNLCFTKYDRKFLKKMKWSYLVLDEAHQCKNPSTQRFKSLLKLSKLAKNRLLLTGTPLQNNLGELCTLMCFLMPEIMGAKGSNISNLFKGFKTNNSDQSLEDDKRVVRLKSALAPLILRRLKSEVSKELSPKIEKIEMCDMTEYQEKLYNEMTVRSRNQWQRHVELKERNTSGKKKEKKEEEEMDTDIPIKSGLMNNIIVQLRKMSVTPLLFREEYSDEDVDMIVSLLASTGKINLPNIRDELRESNDFQIHKFCQSYKETESYALTNEQLFECSGKFMALKEMLSSLFSENHRILLFSQMTRIMDILEAFLTWLGYSYLRLDGSTPVGERQALIDKYNSDPSIFIFLLSTRAGGLGINLATADTVIFMDISFNPQVERQAEDRAHRIGNTKQVEVYRLIAKNTIEEIILDLVSNKANLNDMMLGEGKHSQTDDLYDIQSTNSLLIKSIGKYFENPPKKKTKKIDLAD
eukprot:TRINITY_DN2391_c0_g1_i1.p1 TRINITY_DN2391_c0_g1~~TRINITY_DN2391_c0_g1_i1.p1  ORF type:complete len:873 (+),score=175.38 TRINITY_DN2391_c0_g1_i1:46-2664(+)